MAKRVNNNHKEMRQKNIQSYNFIIIIYFKHIPNRVFCDVGIQVIGDVVI